MFNVGLKSLKPEIHLLEHILKNFMDDVAKNQGVIYTWSRFILVIQKCFSHARKCIYNLSCRY